MGEFGGEGDGSGGAREDDVGSGGVGGGGGDGSGGVRDDDVGNGGVGGGGDGSGE